MTKKDVRILAFESSCDETSTAVIKNGREIESLIVATQIKSHQRFGGVVPEVASRHHIEVITQITKEALDEANATWADIDAIAVTYGPGLVGALLIGVSAAKDAQPGGCRGRHRLCRQFQRNDHCGKDRNHQHRL